MPICPLARRPAVLPDDGAVFGMSEEGDVGGGTVVEGCVIGGSSGANGRQDAEVDADTRHGSAEKASSERPD
ncbi:hypothetical protein GCM10018966_003570 [Streptomyces yanii]